jgi:hypothetical protein
MTRRGTLAYYLAAWVIGSFVVALLFMAASGTLAASALLLNYFFVLIAGAAGLLFFALFLRLATRLLKTYSLWIWMPLGAGLFSALVFAGALISERQPIAWQSGLPGTLSSMIFRGAEAVRQSGFWQAPLDGAATAAVLCLVDRAFAKVHETPETTTPKTKQSPA